MVVQMARHLHTPISEIESMQLATFFGYCEALGKALQMEAPKPR